MVANKHELIANAAMAQLHKMWPCTFDIEIPEAPAGWSWTMAHACAAVCWWQPTAVFPPSAARWGLLRICMNLGEP